MNCNLIAHEKGYDPMIGREMEVEEISEILCRRNKNNPMLLGEPGVGKTALIEALAQKIVRREAPEFLLNKQIFSLVSLEIWHQIFIDQKSGLVDTGSKFLKNSLNSSITYV